MWLHSFPEGSSVSRYDTYKQVEKATGRTPVEMQNKPTLRPLLNSTFDAFNQLPETSYSEIKAYIELTGNHLEWWEVEAIMELSKYRGATWQQKPQP